MERFSRDQKPAAKAPAAEATPASATRSAAAGKSATPPSWAAKLLIVMLIVVALVVTGALAVGAFVDDNGDDLVKQDQYQAVFLDNGQVYFGKLSNTDKSYIQLQDIYYLQVNQTVQPEQVDPGQDPGANQQAQISLAKLGNELHGPEDQMFIHRDKIVFWENLKNDGQVATAITDFVQNGGN